MNESLNKSGFTQVSNFVFDVIIPQLSVYEQSIFLRIYRQTIGWNKEWDRISYSQFLQTTRIGSRREISWALKELRKKKLIKIEKSRMNSYSINLETIMEQYHPGTVTSTT